MDSAAALLDTEPDGAARNVLTGLAKLGLALRNESWRKRGETGLTPTQAELLVLLRTADPVGLRLAELADGLGVTHATASESLRALHEKRLVRKSRDPRDGRALAITLTDRGRREADREATWPDLFLAAAGSLTSEEQTVFLRGLVTMIRSLQDQGRIPVARMCASCRFFRPHVHDSAERPHHCAFVDAAFGDRELRLDCADYQPTDDRRRSR
jgi:DNA-binding MarR family transcriptional regulator